MSIEAVSKVLAAGGLDPTTKLVLVGLANHAHPDGSNAFPSVDTLAVYAGVHARSVKRHLGLLRESKRIEATSPARRGRPTTYRLDFDVICGDNLAPQPVEEQVTPVTSMGDTDVLVGVTPVSDWGDTGTSSNRQEPSKEPSENLARSRERKPDLIFEELFLIETGEQYNPSTKEHLTGSARGALNKAAGEIRALGVTPEELAVAISMWPALFPGATCTATAVAKHLPRLKAATRGLIARGTGGEDIKMEQAFEAKWRELEAEDAARVV